MHLYCTVSASCLFSFRIYASLLHFSCKMFRYIITIWLVSFYSSSGAPAPNTSDLATSLIKLANSCENSFLSTQIKSRLKDCHELVPPSNEKQFQCMLFYDINRQLCAAVASSRMTLNVDYTPKIIAAKDVSEICLEARNWNFTDIGEVYKKTVTVLFQDPIRCARICSADNNDVMNVESNYYCKYFQWGSDMLKTKQTLVPTQSNTGAAAVPNQEASAPVNLPASTTRIAMKPVEKAMTSKLQATLDNASLHAINEKPEQTVVTDVKSTSEKASSAVNGEQSVAVPPMANSETVPAQKEAVPAKEGLKDNNEAVISLPNALKTVVSDEQPPSSIAGQTEPEKKDELASSVPKEESNDKKPHVTTSAGKKIDSLSANNQVEQPKSDIGDPDDYQNEDSDEGRGISDTQGGDDADGQVLGDFELKTDLEQNKNEKRIDFNNDIALKEYSNALAEGFPEEDDHFFPFFLTAIIMVVLLYVLYHNKSKVSKVIMGLIVEGRQPGSRRRNSRGHAYRRLDTLEQAMSASTAAPPSKIIIY